MKNLFYVCLVTILSLGSTGLTTVEEGSCDFSCGQMSNQVYQNLMDETNGNEEYSWPLAQDFFEFCNGVYCDEFGDDYLW